MTALRQKTVVITQSNYIPWRGYFDMIRQADVFVLLDVVQYTRRDWRNRNLIKTPAGTTWLTIPAVVSGRYSQSIDETLISDRNWATSHIRSLELNYRRAAAYDEVAPWLFDTLRTAAESDRLSACNESILKTICAHLGIVTPILRCVDVLGRDALRAMAPSARLVQVCKALGAERYLTGPAARNYLDATLFAQSNIEIAWMNYDQYREYPQCWGGFEPRVSIVDLLLNCGAQAGQFLTGVT